ncbi:MAG: hypothetical protein FWE78_00205 [Methanimicrococcus sp.]|nr:hypothetical protein [Methanimicrococcus sp.]
MEIEETFSNLEEIKNRLEKEGFTFRISFDETDEDDDVSLIDVETADFAVEADPKKIEKWEAELPDNDDFEDENDDDGFEDETSGDGFKDETGNDGFGGENGDGEPEVVYFDLFKKKVYLKTLIFQKEDEAGGKIYKLIGFCEAPMGGSFV